MIIFAYQLINNTGGHQDKHGKQSMKAKVIISTEYKYNQPSVFAYVNGQYYGCMIYPRSRNYPTDMNYWRNATSSDADRYFSVTEVEFSDNDFGLIKNLHNEINEAESNLINDNVNPWIPAPKSSKNSKEYKEYLAKMEAQNKAQREIWEKNQPFEKIIYNARTEMRKLIVNALPNEN
ncbi:MAG TPA: hypothetical protein VK152_00365 [Paludibacter sp.]|nr:hypothetical protein [Paludibacter sp.]